MEIRRRLCAGIGALALGVVMVSDASALPIFGYAAGNALVTFDSAAPGTILTTVAVTGLAAGETAGSIDFRPATGVLYMITNTGARLYTINTSTGVATQVGADGQFALNGSGFGMDFNPTVDRIRATSAATEQNLRIHPDTGALVSADTALAYSLGDPWFGTNPNIAGVAYTNNFAGALTTTLYGLDAAADVLVTINPPNAGSLNSVGAVGINLAGDIGFDIGPGNVAYFSSGAGSSSLYSLNLATGAATLIGGIGGGLVLRGISIAPAAVPEPSTAVLLGLGILGSIVARRRR